MGRKGMERLPALREKGKRGDISKVTGKMRLAAELDAAGLTAKQIEEASNGAVKASYVAELRGKPGYVALREAALKARAEGILLVIEALKAETVGIARQALAVIEESLRAVDSDDRPIWSVRQAAAKMALDNPAIKAALGMAITGDEDDGSKTVVGGEIHVHFGEQHLHEAPVSSTVIEHPDIAPDPEP